MGGTLTFDGAGFHSQGGAATITAGNVVLTYSQATPNTAAVGRIEWHAHHHREQHLHRSRRYFRADRFSQVDLTAGQAIAFSGTGSLDAGAAYVTLTAPELLVNAAATQALTTTGVLDILPGAGEAPANPPPISVAR